MSDDLFIRRDVVWHPAPFKSGPQERPYVVLTDSNHPFYGEEYGVVALTRTNRPPAVELSAEAWALGDPGGESYASPWYIFTLKHEDVIRPKGRLADTAVDRIAERVGEMIGAV
ncbi:type II toxin-antitoxin system PemK/MazF family toxin [Halobaculum sp. MBLA0143]|uniref:type II toxin-antitoxin system PemK/MazF family toxin n=1 Tax=Halobaculum sp. MBLA0143 TaxID=3079933 RepID=UPI003524AD0C